MSSPVEVGIVVPTKNSSRTLEECLASIASQTRSTKLVVVDNFSTDSTTTIARRFAEGVHSRGPERSAQRNFGAGTLDVDIVGFIDSDMILPPNLVEEVIELMVGAVGAVIVPERTIGDGYWTRVRAFERTFYDGDDQIEAARFFSKRVFDEIGGFDERLTGPEDWDITRRARDLVEVVRTRSRIDHQESYLGYRDACSKKRHYAHGLAQYSKKHGRHHIFSLLRRPYFRRPWKLLADPWAGVGLLALKAGEAWMVLGVLLKDRLAKADR